MAAAWPLFLGTNIPWNRFGYDIGGGAWDRSWFENYFKSISGSQNSVRFFLHADGRASPHFATDGSVIALAQPTHGGEAAFKRELGELIELTKTHRLVLQISLWSFDMCRSNGFPVRADLISDAAKTASYVSNALEPLLEIIDDGCEHCILEVMNEPEWCTDDPRLDRCVSTTCVSTREMQRFVATITAAIHRHSPTRKVTVGSASLKWSAPSANGRSVANLWSDDEMTAAARAAGLSPDASPCLDLLNVHFWNWQEREDGFGPCNADDAAFWLPTKPLVYAEMVRAPWCAHFLLGRAPFGRRCPIWQAVPHLAGGAPFGRRCPASCWAVRRTACRVRSKAWAPLLTLPHPLTTRHPPVLRM